MILLVIWLGEIFIGWFVFKVWIVFFNKIFVWIYVLFEWMECLNILCKIVVWIWIVEFVWMLICLVILFVCLNLIFLIFLINW